MKAGSSSRVLGTYASNITTFVADAFNISTNNLYFGGKRLKAKQLGGETTFGGELTRGETTWGEMTRGAKRLGGETTGNRGKQMKNPPS